MKSKYFLLLLITFNLLSCKVKRTDHPLYLERKQIIQTSDLQKLQESNIIGYVSFINNEGNNVKLTDNDDNYQESVKISENPFGITYKYDKNSLALRSETMMFYDNPVGFIKEYDQQGNIVNQINNDDGWDFSVTNLIDKMNNDFHINLMKVALKLSVTRNADVSANVFEYHIFYPLNSTTFRYFKINGKNGAVISDYIGKYIE
ncbi:MAG: hypothetical protein EOP45_06215 [Sphingobacteriaceae bacterium]|nr:MAG: hypothetical protein EOP45_06215 [Sphingobacteriaceae bacterium]